MATPQIVCLVLAVSAVSVTAQFFPDFRSSKKIMDEGFEFFMKNPSYLMNMLSSRRQTHSPRGFLNKPSKNIYDSPVNVDRPVNAYDRPVNAYDRPLNAYDPFMNVFDSPMNAYGSSMNAYGPGMNANSPRGYSEAPPNVGDAPATGGFNSFNGRGIGLFQSKGFMDEGIEHVREFGTPGNMQYLMNNPSLLLGSMFL